MIFISRYLNQKKGCPDEHPFFVSNVLGDPLSHFCGGVGFSAFGNVFGDDACFNGFLHRLSDGSTLLHQTKCIFKHHGGRKDGGYRVGDVFSSCLWVGAVDGFKNTGVDTNTGRW